MDRGAWQATVHRTARVGHNLATKPPPPMTRWKSQRSSAGDLGKKGKHATLPIPVYFRMAFASSTVLVLVAQLCPTLCDPVDCRHGILQARIVEWVAILFSRGSSPPKDQTPVSGISGGFFTIWATKGSRKRKGFFKTTLYSCDPHGHRAWGGRANRLRFCVFAPLRPAPSTSQCLAICYSQ